MATRYCGNARGTIGAPASGFGPGVAYDSPAAYDTTARAALAFADADTLLRDAELDVGHEGSRFAR